MVSKYDQPQTTEEANQSGFGDIDFAAPYIKYLDEDPLARLGFEPSRMHFGDHGKYERLNLNGVYNPPKGSAYTRGMKDRMAKAVEQFLLPNVKVEPDSTYMFPLDYEQIWPVSGTALHESRHRGVERLLEDTDNPNATVLSEEMKMRVADTRNGIEPATTWARDYLGEERKPGSATYNRYNEELDKLNANANRIMGKRPVTPGYAPQHDPDTFATQQQAHIANIDAKYPLDNPPTATAPQPAPAPQRTYYDKPFVEPSSYNNESLRLATMKNYLDQKRSRLAETPQPADPRPFREVMQPEAKQITRSAYYDKPFTPQSQARNTALADNTRFNAEPDRVRAEYRDPGAARDEMVRKGKLFKNTSEPGVVRYSTRNPNA